MRNKGGLLAILFLCVYISCKASIYSDTSTVVLHGYVVQQFKKQDILDKFKKSNSIPIDSYLRTFFLPLEKGTLDIMTDSINRLDQHFIVFLPSQETNELINEFCKDKATLIVDNYHIGRVKPNSGYFEIKGKANEQYLYRYYYMECRAIKKSLPNTSHNAFELNIPFNKSVSTLTCYFVFDTLILQPIDSVNSEKIRHFDINREIVPHEVGHSLPNH